MLTEAQMKRLGLNEIGRTNDNVVLAGSYIACKRVAAVHGMEVDRYEGAIMGSVNGVGTYALPDPDRPMMVWFKPSGLMVKAQDGYTLSVPLILWDPVEAERVLKA